MVGSSNVHSTLKIPQIDHKGESMVMDTHQGHFNL